MKKLLFLTALLFSLNGIAQQKSSFWENVRYGGGFSANFGNQTTINISPSAVYDFKKGFSLGAGLNYSYTEIGTLTTNVYGTSLISLYQTNLGFLLSGEFDYNFANQKSHSGAITTNFPALHLGIAYNQGRFAFGVRYDVLYNENKTVFASPFSPILRFYF